ncbi:unnamed protein product [Litomosoides sigmodontis]|uniref:Uncharacterized protein n=1 Tax=Litomosoides sigmodontis TaxID=42156 RepID=A0A3P6TNP0_LITSI|nr:unnamed protein product [Litomosoides sigmodontis]
MRAAVSSVSAFRFVFNGKSVFPDSNSMDSALSGSPSQTGTTLSDQPGQPKTNLLLKQGQTIRSAQENFPQNENSPTPSITDVEGTSEQAPEMFNVSAGEATEELSDISEFEGTISKTLKSTRLATLIYQMSPFIRNKKVRLMLIINFFATIINMLLLLALITLIIWNIVLSAHVQSTAGIIKFPCLFTYLDWSACSSTCRISGQDYPQRLRKVNRSSIVQARNGGKPECPANLADRVDSAPCNTYLCPTNLSNYGFSKFCHYNDANLRNDGGCFRIRDVPLDDRLILIDTNLTEACDCSSTVHL